MSADADLVSVAFYDAQTGLFTGQRFSGPRSALDANIPPGMAAFEGEVDPQTQRLDLETMELVPHVYELSLDQARAMARRDLMLGRERRKSAPVAYAGAMFDADPTSRENLLGWIATLQAGGTLPAGFVWRDAANVDHPADAQWLAGLAQAITLRGTVVYAESWARKQALDAATDLAGIAAAIDGWL